MNNQCPICLNNESTEVTLCDHAFCTVCLDSWLGAGHFSCPLCREYLFPGVHEEVEEESEEEFEEEEFEETDDETIEAEEEFDFPDDFDFPDYFELE